jgi:transcriptional regulator with XRE-family HTH domain
MIRNEVVSRIAQKIQSTRLEKNLTMQELATRARVSKGLLSKIENSRTIPSLPVFVTIIQSLGISLKEFFQDVVLVNGKNFILIKKDEYSIIEKEGRPGFQYRHILSENISNCSIEVSTLTLAPGTKGKPSTTDGFELKYIISGNCSYFINQEEILLEAGDTIYFDASVPHLPVNRSSNQVSMLVIYFLMPH